jgi:O-antigen/teichoic acid export membrane protein
LDPLFRIRRWGRLFSEYSAAQGLIQLLGLLAGLLLVNLLPVREYALYAFALSVFTFLTVFSDLGVSNALLYFRRETRLAGHAFAPYVAAAYRLRYALVAAGACAGVLFMAALAPERGFSAGEIAAVGAVLVAAAWIQVGASVMLLQLRLEGLYRESYFAEMCGNAARLAAVLLIGAAAATVALFALSTAVLGALVTRLVAGARIPAEADLPRQAEPLRHIARYVLPVCLSAAYFSIQAPLTVWLSAYFAGTESIAEVGALGRLGLIFSLVSGFVGTVLIPRLSLVTDDALYLRRYLECWAVLLPFGVLVVALAHLGPQWFLLLLGDAYRDLRDGVLLVAASATLNAWGGYVIAVNNARGWVRHQALLLVAYALLQVALIATLDLSSTLGVLYFGFWSSVAGLLLQAVVNVAGFLKPDAVALRRIPRSASNG